MNIIESMDMIAPDGNDPKNRSKPINRRLVAILKSKYLYRKAEKEEEWKNDKDKPKTYTIKNHFMRYLNGIDELDKKEFKPDDTTLEITYSQLYSYVGKDFQGGNNGFSVGQIQYLSNQLNIPLDMIFDSKVLPSAFLISDNFFSYLRDLGYDTFTNPDNEDQICIIDKSDGTQIRTTYTNLKKKFIDSLDIALYKIKKENKKDE